MKPLIRILFFILQCISINTWAQKDSVKLKPLKYVSLNIGTSGPESNFIEFSPSFGSTSLGWAETGVMINGDVQFTLIESWLAVGGKIGFSENNSSTGNGNYYGVWGLAGMYLNLPIKRVSLSARFLIGTMDLNSPYINDRYANYSPVSGGATDTTQIVHANTVAFAYNIGISLRINPYQQFSIQLNMDFYGANRNNAIEVKENGNSAYSYPAPSSASWNTITKSPVRANLLCFSFGVAYNLTK